LSSRKETKQDLWNTTNLAVILRNGPPDWGAGLDGLGVDAGAHAEHEHIIIEDIPRRAAFLARLIETI
jgi:acetylornithine deacetylase/succinyl-diaminopimelate desuccinylase-like protein